MEQKFKVGDWVYICESCSYMPGTAYASKHPYQIIEIDDSDPTFIQYDLDNNGMDEVVFATYEEAKQFADEWNDPETWKNELSPEIFEFYFGTEG